MMNDQQNEQSNLIEQARELLSPYLDDEVTPTERAFVETMVTQSPELRTELESLRQTITFVNNLPRVSAPRPFTLTQVDVGTIISEEIAFSESKPSGWWSWLKLKPLMGGAAVLAAILIVGVYLISSFNLLNRQETTMIASAPTQAQAEQVAADQAAPPLMDALEAPAAEPAETLEELEKVEEAGPVEAGEAGAAGVTGIEAAQDSEEEMGAADTIETETTADTADTSTETLIKPAPNAEMVTPGEARAVEESATQPDVAAAPPQPMPTPSPIPTPLPPVVAPMEAGETAESGGAAEVAEAETEAIEEVVVAEQPQVSPDLTLVPPTASPTPAPMATALLPPADNVVEQPIPSTGTATPTPMAMPTASPTMIPTASPLMMPTATTTPAPPPTPTVQPTPVRSIEQDDADRPPATLEARVAPTITGPTLITPTLTAPTTNKIVDEPSGADSAPGEPESTFFSPIRLIVLIFGLIIISSIVLLRFFWRRG